MNEEIKVYLEKYSEGNYQNFSSNFAGTDCKWIWLRQKKRNQNSETSFISRVN
jgi:hypothetical protein